MHVYCDKKLIKHFCLKYAHYSQNIFLAVFAFDFQVINKVMKSRAKTIETWSKMAENSEQKKKNAQISLVLRYNIGTRTMERHQDNLNAV